MQGQQGAVLALALAPGCVVEDGDTQPSMSDYIMMFGLRLVKPYYFDFKCHVKQRWEGKNVIDIFCEEFPALDRQYYERAFQSGRLRIEGLPDARQGTPVRVGMCIRHFLHRHEPAVPEGGVKVLGCTDDIVAVSKPPGMPVHVAGQYRKNTVLGVLQAEQPHLMPLHVTHRLDKPVSGLLLFARGAAAANRIRQRLEGHELSKVYLARVMGRFPTDSVTVDVPLTWDPRLNKAAVVLPKDKVQPLSQLRPHAEMSGLEVLNAVSKAPPTSIGTLPPRPQACVPVLGVSIHLHEHDAAAAPATSCTDEVGVQRQQHERWEHQLPSANGAISTIINSAIISNSSSSTSSAPKHARTDFSLVSVSSDGLTSLVHCQPRTGRTHQIRVHLAHLGHPVANDTLYGGTFGPPLEEVVLGRRSASCRLQQRDASTPVANATPALCSVAGADGQTVSSTVGSLGNISSSQATLSVALVPEGGPSGGNDERAAPLASSNSMLGAEGAGNCAVERQPACLPFEGVLGKRPAADASDAAAVKAAADMPMWVLNVASSGGADSVLGDGALHHLKFRRTLQPPLPKAEDGSSSFGGSAALAETCIPPTTQADMLAGIGLATRDEMMLPLQWRDAGCVHCPHFSPADYPLQPMPLWLHCLRYSSNEWSFEAPVPAWAAEA